MIKLTRGFFFYQTILRQDLLSKLFVVEIFDVPTPLLICFLTPSQSKLVETTVITLFRLWLLVEWLGGVDVKLNSMANVKEPLTYHFSQLTLLPFVSLKATINKLVYILNLFVNVFFMWFQGYFTLDEVYSVKEGYLSRRKWEACKGEERDCITYVNHTPPFLKRVDKVNKSVVLDFEKLSFLNWLPTDISLQLGGFKAFVQFQASNIDYIVPVLSALRFRQRSNLIDR